MKAKDFLVECANPKAFDKTINSFGAVLIQDNSSYVQKDGYYVMRCLGDSGFLKFAIENQGYGKIIKELDDLC